MYDDQPGTPLDPVVLVLDLLVPNAADWSQTTAASTVASRRLHGPDVDQIFASETSLGEILWSLPDHQGTVRDIAVRHSLSGQTAVVNHIAYTAFGQIVSETAAAGSQAALASSTYGFTGREWDADLGLAYYRARWYDPGSGRFLSDDPLGFGGGDPNLQRYVRNDPLNRRDPSGLRDDLEMYARDETRMRNARPDPPNPVELAHQALVDLYREAADLAEAAQGGDIDEKDLERRYKTIEIRLKNYNDLHAIALRWTATFGPLGYLTHAPTLERAYRLPTKAHGDLPNLQPAEIDRISRAAREAATSARNVEQWAGGAETTLVWTDGTLTVAAFATGIGGIVHAARTVALKEGFKAGAKYGLIASAKLAATLGAGYVVSRVAVEAGVDPRLVDAGFRIYAFWSIYRATRLPNQPAPKGADCPPSRTQSSTSSSSSGPNSQSQNAQTFDVNRVAGPNPNNLRQRAVKDPTAGEGGVYLKPQDGKTKIGSTDNFRDRYPLNESNGIEVEIPQTRSGHPQGVNDSAYPWSARRQRRFDEEYIDRITPSDVRFRAPNARSPVDPDKWEKYRHIFGYGDVPVDFGF